MEPSSLLAQLSLYPLGRRGGLITPSWRWRRTLGWPNCHCSPGKASAGLTGLKPTRPAEAPCCQRVDGRAFCRRPFPRFLAGMISTTRPVFGSMRRQSEAAPNVPSGGGLALPVTPTLLHDRLRRFAISHPRIAGADAATLLRPLIDLGNPVTDRPAEFVERRSITCQAHLVEVRDAHAQTTGDRAGVNKRFLRLCRPRF
jgi:hypothetical protein